MPQLHEDLFQVCKTGSIFKNQSEPPHRQDKKTKIIFLYKLIQKNH